jgi:hypothetical protein
MPKSFGCTPTTEDKSVKAIVAPLSAEYTVGSTIAHDVWWFRPMSYPFLRCGCRGFELGACYGEVSPAHRQKRDVANKGADPTHGDQLQKSRLDQTRK